MVAPLRDDHVSIEVDDEDIDIFDLAIDQRFVEECEALGEACDDHEDYIDREHDRVREIVTDNYLDGSATPILNDEVFWGRLSPEAGYLYIGSTSDFSEEETFASDLALLEPMLDRVFDELGSLPGLVIDLRFNGGGYDELALAIADRFADQRRVAFKKSAFTPQGLTAHQSFFIEPSRSPGYHGSVAVLIGPYTASAAENLLLAFQTLPNFAFVGELTEGIHSDVLERTLPIGIKFSLSNEVFTSADGEVYEGRGIPPTVEAPFLPAEDRVRGVDSALETAVSLLSETRS
jgi:C-terminal processing protease CtpA/Prc